MTKKSTISPIRDRIVVEVQEPDRKHLTVSVLVMPDTIALDDVSRGIVLAVGPGFLTAEGAQIPLGIEEGQTVLFDKMSGKKVLSYGKSLLILREQEVLGVENKPEVA